MYVTFLHSSFAFILMGNRELVALLGLSSWCLVMVVWLFLAVLWVCLRLPDHTHLLFLGNTVVILLITFENYLVGTVPYIYGQCKK